MQQIGKRANFSGHFSEYPPSLSKRMTRAFVESGQRTRRLSEIQIHCEDTLRQTEPEPLLCHLSSKLDVRVRSKQDDPDVEISNQGAKTLLAGAQGILGLLASGDVSNDDQGTGPSIQFDQCPGKLSDANLPGLRHANKLLISDFRVFLEFGHNLHPATRVLPQVHFQRCSSKSLFVCITRKSGEAVIDFQK